MNRFAKVGLIERIRDGREVRVVLGELGDRLVKGSLELVKEQFMKSLVTIHKEDCPVPIVLSQDIDHIRLRVNYAEGEHFEFTITLTDWDFQHSDQK